MGRAPAISSSARSRSRDKVRSTSAARPVPPLRWNGSRELNHLLWLVIHHPEQVSPVLTTADPELVTDYPPARRAIALLMTGEQLTDVMDSVADPELNRVLLAAAARDGLYSAENAHSAAGQVLSRLEITAIDRSIGNLEQAIDACAIDGDKSRYFNLVKDRQALQKRKDAIKSRFAR